MLNKAFIGLLGLIFSISLQAAVSIPTSTPVRPGGVVVSGQAEVMPHSSFSAIDATLKGGYKTLKIKVARQANAKSGIFKISYYPHFTTLDEKLLFQSGNVSIRLIPNQVFLAIGKEKFSAKFDFQPKVWYEFTLHWEKNIVKLLIDNKDYITLKRANLPIGETFSLGGIPDGMLRDISLDYPRISPIEELSSNKLNFFVRANNPTYLCFDYFAHGKSVKLKLKPRLPIAKGDKFYLVQSAGNPMHIVADKAGQLIIDLPPSYSNRIELRKDQGNLLSKFDFANFPNNWKVESIDNYKGKLPTIKVPVAEKVIPAKKALDQAKVSNKIFRSKNSALIVDRKRDTGSFILTAKNIPLKSNTQYLLSIYYKTLENLKHDGSFMFQAKVFENNVLKQNFREYHPCTPLRENKQWNLVPLQFKTIKSNKNITLQVELITDAGPCKIAFDDLDLREFPNNVFQPMPKDSDVKKILTNKALLNHINKRPQVSLPTFPASGVAGYDGNVYKMMGKAGADLHFIKIGLDNRRRIPAWRSDGSYDFTEFDELICHVLSYAPNARVAIMVGLDPALDFGLRFPNAAWRDINDKISYFNAPDAKFYPERAGKKYPYVSYTAPDFKREAGKYLYNLGLHLKKQPWGKTVAAIHVFGGGDGQWFYRPMKNDLSEMMDRSPGNLVAMRQAIRKYYNNNLSALRKAWGDNKVTFETITFPSKASYKLFNYLRDPNNPQARKIIDFIKLYPKVITETLGFTVNEFERGLGRRVLKSRYFYGTSMGHLLKDSPFDIMVSVPPYGVSRLHGNEGRVHQPPASATLHNKIYLAELDLRTTYSPISIYGAYNSIRRLGVEPGPEGFANIMRKMAAPVITNNQGWWYLMIGGNPSMQDEFSYVVKESFDALKVKNAKTVDMDGQIAFFWDEEARNYMGDRFGWAMDQHAVHQGQRMLARSGVGYQQYLLSDLTHPKRKKAKVNIFGLGTTLTEQQISYIEKNLQKDGNTLVFIFDAGRTAPGGFEKNIFRLTGMKIKAAPTKVMGLAAFGSDRYSHPLSKYIKNAAPFTGGPFLMPMYYVDDPSAKPLANWARTNLVGAAVKKHKNWTAVYLGIPLGLAVKPEFIRQLAIDSGIKPFAPVGEVSYAGNGIVAIHAISDGVKKLQWQENADVFDLTTNKIIKKNVKEINLDMKYGQTSWFRLLKVTK